MSCAPNFLKRNTVALIALLMVPLVNAEGILYPIESESRSVQLLDGIWNFRLCNKTDSFIGHREGWYKGLKKTGATIPMPVPSSYNDITQDKAVRDHLGVVWYDRTFYVPVGWKSSATKVWLRFGSVHYEAHVVVSLGIGYMIMSRDGNIVRNGNINIGDLSFEEVEKFKYLGVTVTNINDTREEIKRRINMGNACYYSVEKLLSSSLLSKNLKVRIYKTVILPVLLYGCETWTLTLREEHRLRVFENKVLRKIFGAKRDEVTGEWRKLHNTELHALYSSPDIIRNIKSRRLRWAGHVARMGESRNAYRVLVGRPEGKRPLGRPRRRWEDNIKMDLREVGYDDRDWLNLAQDRDRWRAYVRAAMNLRYVNSELVTSHAGGHVPFQCEVTSALKYGEENLISVAVNNTLTDVTVPQGGFDNITTDSGAEIIQTYKFDFFNYAGIHRPVVLYTTPSIYIDDISVDTRIHGEIGVIEYSVTVEGHSSGNSTVLVSLVDRDGSYVIRDVAGSQGELQVPEARLWWPYLMDSDPGYLYTLEFAPNSVTPQTKGKDLREVLRKQSFQSWCQFPHKGKGVCTFEERSKVNSWISSKNHLFEDRFEPRKCYQQGITYVAPRPGDNGIRLHAVGDIPGDVYRLPVGIRKVEWNNTSVTINGKPIYIRGFGRHEDSAVCWYLIHVLKQDSNLSRI
ncbi:hypothetical protein ANN_20780 [Periplaneta americana]|uniref:Glycosyl hydrolases family 2 sugar binding domain-containing protein n=1 Tax=Periplaneta americana TaxID=6978 RepID=A0ABQ8SDL4_PERAM|nr:hypothetical protein ANN_20780 [Periplaneta americana]